MPEHAMQWVEFGPVEVRLLCVLLRMSRPTKHHTAIPRTRISPVTAACGSGSMMGDATPGPALMDAVVPEPDRGGSKSVQPTSKVQEGTGGWEAARSRPGWHSGICDLK